MTLSAEILASVRKDGDDIFNSSIKFRLLPVCLQFKTLSVTPTETVRDVIKMVLSHLEMSGTADVNNFRLWLKTGSTASGAGSVDGDSSSSNSSTTPYPLIGHELPFAIKMNCLREYISRAASENDNDTSGLDVLDHCNNIYNADPAARCQFILRLVLRRKW